MTNKFKKVCTKCVEANDHIPISAEFEVQVIFGTCDCCKEKGLLIPFELFFNKMVDLKPHTELKKVVKGGKEIDVNKLVDDVLEKFNKIEQPKSKWQEEVDGKLKEFGEALKESAMLK